MINKFRTADGRLTPYSFACGYIETKSTDLGQYRTADLYTEIYMEHEHFHVRQFDRRLGSVKFRVMWEVFDTLKEAISLFDAQPGVIYYEERGS